MDINLAILPFRELSGDRTLDLMMQGFTEDLMINLSKFKGLSLLALESTSYIRGIEEVDAIAKLGADYTLGGSYRGFQDQIRIAIQLIRVKDGKVVFASDYRESVEAIFNMQDVVLKQIVNAIQQHIDYDLLSYSYKKSDVQLAAYENYLIGMDLLRKRGIEHDAKAREYFEAALAIDPKYARAYTGLSLSYLNEWSCQLWDRWDVSKKGALDNALKALELDENDYVALAVAGRTILFSEDYERAEHYLRKSISINPNDADNLLQVAFSFLFLSHTEEAEKLYLKACRLNPSHRDSYFAYGSNIYFELGDFEQAISLGTRIGPENAFVDFPAYMAAAYFHLSQPDKMQEMWKLYLKKYGQYIAGSATFEESDALAWQIRVNPYRGITNLRPFWEYIATLRGWPLSGGRRKAVVLANTFHLRDGIWKLTFNGETALVPDAKGFQDIFKLMQRCGEEVHCSELMGSVLTGDRGVEVFDLKARKNYQKRVAELQSEMAEAEDLGDSGRLGQLQEEYDTLLNHLSSALGLNGRHRTAITSVEKARSAVTLRIRSSIKKLEKVHPHLARHLRVTIRTGTFCSYKPDTPVDWEFLD